MEKDDEYRTSLLEKLRATVVVFRDGYSLTVEYIIAFIHSPLRSTNDFLAYGISMALSAEAFHQEMRLLKLQLYCHIWRHHPLMAESREEWEIMYARNRSSPSSISRSHKMTRIISETLLIVSCCTLVSLMKAGILLPHIGEPATRENILYIAKEAEKEDLDSIWVIERLLFPVKPQTPYVGTPDGSLPVQYQNILDPIATLIYLAGNTERISLGTSIIDMLFHNPVTLARQLATLDVLSGGRVIAGFGIGWSKDEYDVSGIPYKHRGARANEFLQVLKRIWTDDVVEFKGQFYNIPPSKIGPKPVQKPHPQILLGGFSPNTFSRIVNYADGWLPIAGFGPLEQLEQTINGLREEARKKDKNPSNIRIVVLTYPNVLDSSAASSPNQERLPMSGTLDQIGSDVERIKAMGAEHIIFGYAFSPIGSDMKKMIAITKQFARSAK